MPQRHFGPCHARPSKQHASFVAWEESNAPAWQVPASITLLQALPANGPFTLPGCWTSWQGKQFQHWPCGEGKRTCSGEQFGPRMRSKDASTSLTCSPHAPNAPWMSRNLPCARLKNRLLSRRMQTYIQSQSRQEQSEPNDG